MTVKDSPACGSGYRPDIDGLRAVAVVAVMLFHFELSIASGGFVGVDVFFVISGFLITNLLIRNMNAGTYSIAHFYERRIRRIVPAYAVVMIVCLIVSTMIMLPEDFKSLGGGIASSALFASNAFFWLESSDYFNSAPELKPVLHTWSLSVEEQFYILFPLILASLHRPQLWKFARSVTLCAFLASFGLSVWGVDNAPVVAFYLTPTRAWEILAGSLLAFGILPAVRGQLVSSIVGMTGLILIVVAVCLFDTATPFPGWAAALPVLGAVLVIHAGMQTTNGLASRVLALPPLRFLGLMSYSLYLWHWPTIVLSKYFFVGGLAGETFVLGAVSFVLAYLSWRYVERPFRATQAISPRTWFTATAILSVLLMLAGYSVYSTDGIPGRVPAEIRMIADKRTYQGPMRECGYVYALRRDAGTVCALGAANMTPDFVVVGDSHATAISGSIFAAATQAGRAGFLVSDSGYRPFLGFVKKGEEEKYKYINKLLIEVVEQNPQIRDIIVPIYWRQAVSVDRYRAEIDRIVDGRVAAETGLSRLVARYPDKRFLFLLSPPNSHLFGGAPVARAAWFGQEFRPQISRAQFDDVVDVYRPVVHTLQSFANVQVLDIAARLCDTRICSGLLGGDIAFSDDNHLSYKSSLAFESDFERFLSSARPATAQR